RHTAVRSPELAALGGLDRNGTASTPGPHRVGPLGDLFQSRSRVGGTQRRGRLRLLGLKIFCHGSLLSRLIYHQGPKGPKGPKGRSPRALPTKLSLHPAARPRSPARPATGRRGGGVGGRRA